MVGALHVLKQASHSVTSAVAGDLAVEIVFAWRQKIVRRTVF
jgi:hypothetical protein